MKKIQKILEKIFQVILLIIIVINLIAIVSVKIYKNSYPKIFGYTYFEVISGSMEPTIKVGDEIFVKITKNVEENDIISFKEDGQIVTHRLIKIDDGKYTTKGDNNDSEDKPIYKNDIIGKVIFTIPYLGKIKYVITNIYFLVILIISYAIYEIIAKK